VVLATVQGVAPAFAESFEGTGPGDAGYYAVTIVTNGAGTVSWSGDLSGSTSTDAYLYVPIGGTVTFTVTSGQLGSWNVDGQTIQGSSFTLTGYGYPVYNVITANLD
jgi:hypothetical protein